MGIDRIKNKSLTQVTKKAIYDYIKSLDISKSNKLPSEEELSESLGVSRITVRAALNELATEGIIFRKHGKGTFVNKEALQMKVPFAPARELKAAIIQSGYEARVGVVKCKIIYADEDDASKLQINPGDKILYVEKIFYADDDPAMFCTDKIIEGHFKEPVSKKELGKSIFDYVADISGKQIAWDKVELSAIAKEDNNLLNSHFENANTKAFLKCEVINFDINDTPIILSNEFIDTNFIRYNLIRQKIKK